MGRRSHIDMDYRAFGYLANEELDSKKRVALGKVKSDRKNLVYAQRFCTICGSVKTPPPPLPNIDSTPSSQYHQTPSYMYQIASQQRANVPL